MTTASGTLTEPPVTWRIANCTDGPMTENFDGYLGIFLALILSTTVMPIPEELPVIAAGIMCGHSDTQFAQDRSNPERLRWWIMLPVVIVGAVIGDVVLYTLGRWRGPWLLDRAWIKRRLLSPDQREKIEKNFDKHGVAVLLGVRLLPGIRGWVFLIAGMVRLPLWKFIVADLIYAIPIVNLMFWLAYWLTDQFKMLVDKLDEHKPLVVSHVLAAVAGALIYKYLLSRHVPTGETPKVPAIISMPAGAIGHAVESAYESVTGRHHHDKPTETEVTPPAIPPTVEVTDTQLRRSATCNSPPTGSQSLATSPTRGEDRTQASASGFLPSPLVGEGGESSSRVGGKPSQTEHLSPHPCG